MKISFRESRPKSLNTADSELRIGQLANRINWLVDQQRVIKNNTEQYLQHQAHSAHIPSLYHSHWAWADVRLTRSNCLVLDPYRRVDNTYYYHYNSDQSTELAFYRDCHDPSQHQRREPVEDFSRIIRVDYKLVDLSATKEGREGQLNILRDWLVGNSPLKLLHISIDQYDSTDSLGLLSTLRGIEWTSMLSIEIFDKTVHRQNGHYLDQIVELLRPVVRRCLTAELHSQPSNHLGGRSVMWDLKKPEHAVSEYTVLNYNYINFIDAVRSGRIKD